MTDLLNELAGHGIRPQRGGAFRHGDNATTCPQCSAQRHGANKGKPCLSVKLDDDGGAVWRCHHCEWTGNIPGRRAAGVGSFRRPAPKAPIRRPDPPVETPRPDAFLSFFDGRGIARDVVEEMGVYRGVKFFSQVGEERPCVVFPYLRGGELENNKYRDREKNFAQDKDAERALYNFDQIADDVLIWVEGEMDVLACMTGGYRSVTTLPDGAPAKLKDEDDPTRDSDRRFEAMVNAADRLASVRKIIIATDGDGPGGNLAEELARRLGKERCWRVRYPEGCKDANDVLLKLGPDALRLMIESAQPYPIRGVHTAEDFWDDVLALYNGERAVGLTTGFDNLDPLMKLTGTGLLVVVTGIPNHGKSEFVDQLMVNYARTYGWKVGYCSFENAPPRHIAKFAEKIIGKPFFCYNDHRRLRMDEMELEAAREWVRHHIHFIRADDDAPTVDWIIEKSRVLVMRHGIKALIIDPYNEIEHRRQPGKTETEYISEVLGKLRRFGENHGVDVFIVAHPTKLQTNGEGTAEPVPGLYDISGGAHWNNKADIGFTVWRDRSILPRGAKSSTLVKVHKVRSKELGRPGAADFEYDIPTGIYSPIY
ncbi:twinkle protein [Azospirillum oryzae]|uniref:Twinkle protein n=2 Tax=Azospirillum oryzae TaxID=286727 RepID=A0A1X7HPY9_9PROT|nr:twinkle protein [Azospirillum oryzae]